jgi:hypothetical protein
MSVGIRFSNACSNSMIFVCRSLGVHAGARGSKSSTLAVSVTISCPYFLYFIPGFSVF